ATACESVGEQNPKFACRKVRDAADRNDGFVTRAASDDRSHAPRCLHTCAEQRTSHHAGMDRPTAIAQLREQCHAIATAVTCMHPLAPGLADQPAQDEIMKALF